MKKFYRNKTQNGPVSRSLRPFTRLTREKLAFVLKLSVVGVRKMEHLGTTPVKSLESRQALLGLAKILEKPTPGICAYIEREEVALG